MINSDLYNQVLLAPSVECNQLKIISGYASPAMANKQLANLSNDVTVNLIIGMTSSDGIGRGSHKGFCTLDEELDRFKCNYVITLPAVHVKSYIWLKNGVPKLAFTGSGNYSQNAFFGGTKESFALDDPLQCNDLYESILANTLSCLHPDVETNVAFYDEVYRSNSSTKIIPTYSLENTEAEIPDSTAFKSSVKLTLLSSKDNQTHNQSGLNWGQRLGREPNQAYIPIPAQIARSGFFPDRANHFTLITDDGQSFDCAVAQDGDKALETTKSNSILGKYFRNRLGVPLGHYVTTDHLLNYGRTDVTISKIDDETYHMDFSVS